MAQLLGLVFDLDGTLVDSAADLRQAVNHVLVAQGRRAVTLAEIKSFVGDGLQTLMRRAFAATGAAVEANQSDLFMRDFLKAYDTQPASSDQLYPQAMETIRYFRGQEVKIGLCTNKLYQPTLKLLRDTGIIDLFDCIAGCDTFPYYKPHPGHLLGVLGRLNVPAANAVMIGDSANDIEAARGAEVASIAVAHGYTQDAARLGANAIIAGFAELSGRLTELGFKSG